MPRSGRTNPLFLDSEPEVITSRRKGDVRYDYSHIIEYFNMP